MREYAGDYRRIYGTRHGYQHRDREVGELARELAKLRKTNMTEAIAHALRSELKRERDKRPLRERLAELAAKLKAEAGPNHERSLRKTSTRCGVSDIHRHVGDRRYPLG